jgi:hypothetical protein
VVHPDAAALVFLSRPLRSIVCRLVVQGLLVGGEHGERIRWVDGAVLHVSNNGECHDSDKKDQSQNS